MTNKTLNEEDIARTKTREEAITNPIKLPKKKKSKIVIEDKVKSNLNLKQLKFCELYLCSQEYFNNSTRSYAEAYNIDITDTKQYNVAATNASNLLKNPKIIKRLNELLEKDGLNDVAVDKKLSHHIHQYADGTLSLNAIKEYNKVTKRTDDSVKVVVIKSNKEVEAMTDEELEKNTMELLK